MLWLSQQCQSVTLTDLSGVCLFQGQNVQQIDVHEIATPVALLTATLPDGTTTTIKVRVK